MNNLREIAYRVDPALWVRKVLGVTPTALQQTFLRAGRCASILALTTRNPGKGRFDRGHLGAGWLAQSLASPARGFSSTLCRLQCDSTV
jgi:hypothetical protein